MVTKKKKTSTSYQQALKDVKTWIIGQPVQALNENMEEHKKAHVDVYATSMVGVVAAYVNRMEVELQKTIDMIKEQTIITISAMLE
jgi:vacuolar-type H+-ATPase subunit C/Vma6